jgi:hypothetical protein
MPVDPAAEIESRPDDSDNEGNSSGDATFLDAFVEACSKQELVVAEVKLLQKQVKILRRQVADLGGEPFV